MAVKETVSQGMRFFVGGLRYLLAASAVPGPAAFFNNPIDR